MLFLELALIRWTGSNILYLSYFSNFVLLASFLGIGIGFLRARGRRSLFGLAPLALATLVLFIRLFPVGIDRSGSELIFFGALGTRTGLPPWITLPAIFAGVALVMATVADGVARMFARFPPLDAYRLDIVGSLAGIVTFALLSFTGAPPVAWGLVVAAGLLVLLGGDLAWWQAGALAVLVLVLGAESLTPLTSWSPYYKVELHPMANGSIGVRVNGIPHQTIESAELRRSLIPMYALPYQRARTPPRTVLIIGAGTGDDVAIALAQGVEHVDAVEIDPRIHDLGRALHPDRPYQDPRVTAYINDGRAFLEQTRRHYDLILFALPDSLTLVAGQSSLRLESYLFTLEAMRQARAHLTDTGVFGEYNYYRELWLVDRLAATLERAFGRRPCLDSMGQQGRVALLTASTEAAAISCAGLWQPTVAAPAPATDDYPFLYLHNRGIPGFYLLTIALILMASLIMVRASAGPMRAMWPYVDLAFMGAAFLLLETKNVVQFALLFGTTWFVNALVFMGILLAVLAAIEVARRVPSQPPRLLYLALLAALVVAWAVPPQVLLGLPLFPRFVVAVAIAFIPIFIANLVFAQRFRAVGSSTLAFGANLLGAMVGGVLEYSSLILGYRALLIVIALLYGMAFVLGRRRLLA
jgi:Spermine/spermidine synthase domain